MYDITVRNGLSSSGFHLTVKRASVTSFSEAEEVEVQSSVAVQCCNCWTTTCAPSMGCFRRFVLEFRQEACNRAYYNNFLNEFGNRFD